jgi:branched-chain amino acid transport system substrate-binding protein
MVTKNFFFGSGLSGVRRFQMKKNMLVIISVIGFCLVWIIVPTFAEDTIKIGCITPLSGGYANYGINTQRGLEMALEEVNAKGGVKIKGQTYKFEVVTCDDEGQPDKSVTCGMKMASMHKTPIIFTPASWSAFPLMGFNEKNNFLIISTSQSPSFTKKGNKLVIRWIANAETSMPGLVKLLKKSFERNSLSIKKYGIIEADSEVGKQWAEAFVQEWKKEGGVVVAREVVNMNSTDFFTNLTSLIAKSPDAIQLCSAPDEQTTIIAEQARALGYKGIFSTSMTCDGVKLLEMDKSKAADNSFLEGTAWGVGGTLFDELQKKYKDKYKEDPIFIAGFSYEGGRAIAMAIEKAQSLDATEIKKAFGSILPVPNCLFCGHDLDLNTGEIYFPVYLKHVKNGKLIPITE